MKPRTIVYGLGKRFQQYFYEIHDTYNVVGYCDADPEKVAIFTNGMTKEEMSERQNEYEKILITLANQWWQFEVIAELLTQYKIEAYKIVCFEVPSEIPVLRTRKDTLYHPEMIFWGQSNEDAVIYLLSYQMHLDLGNLSYYESGLHNLRVGSATYGLYKLGARGVLNVVPYDALSDEIKIFRSEDKFVGIDEDLQDVLNNNETIDIVILHDEADLKKLLYSDEIFKYKPLIIIMDNIVQDTIEYIGARGYVWYSTLSVTSAVFCRADRYLSEDVWINRG